jgi:hypothetical protein
LKHSAEAESESKRSAQRRKKETKRRGNIWKGEEGRRGRAKNVEKRDTKLSGKTASEK